MRPGPLLSKTERVTADLDVSGRTFRYAWFNGSALRRTSFANTDLHCTNFGHTTFHEVVFDGANINQTKFNSSQIQKASFKHVTFNNAEFWNSKLLDSNLSRAKFYDGSFYGALISGTNANSSVFYGIELTKARFYDVNFSASVFFGVNLNHATFFGVKLTGSQHAGSTWEEADFHGVNLDNAEINAVNANRSRFYGSRMVSTKLTGASLLAASFFGSDLTSADLNLSDFRDTRWEKPANWSSLSRGLLESFRTKKLDALEGRMFLDVVHENANHQFFNQGLETLAKPECVWVDGNGPFVGWRAPSDTCWGKLEGHVVKSICSDDTHSIGTQIVMTPWDRMTQRKLHIALALIETSGSECPSVNTDSRDEICKSINWWFGSERQRDRNSNESYTTKVGVLKDRWRRAIDGGACRTSESWWLFN